MALLRPTVYPKKYAHGFCFAVLCCGYTLTDFPISISLTSLALWQSNDCPSASKATLMNMDKYFMWIHYERLHNHSKAKHNKTVCIFFGINCTHARERMAGNIIFNDIQIIQFVMSSFKIIKKHTGHSAYHCFMTQPLTMTNGFYFGFDDDDDNDKVHICIYIYIHIYIWNRHMVVQPRKYDSNGEGWYLQFDYDN